MRASQWDRRRAGQAAAGRTNAELILRQRLDLSAQERSPVAFTEGGACRTLPAMNDPVVEAARQGAAWFRASLGTVAIEGPDRKTWLNGLVTCDVAKVAPGKAAYGLAVVKVGRILTDLFVVDAGERLLV